MKTLSWLWDWVLTLFFTLCFFILTRIDKAVGHLLGSSDDIDG